MRSKTGLGRWLGSLSLGCLLASGCAWTSERTGLPRLDLPSPWATVRGNKGAAAEEIPAAAKRPAPAKPVAGTKPAGKTPRLDRTEESLAMALLRGRNCERTGDWEKARKIYEALREEHPENLEIVHRLGVVADAQRRHGEAEQLFLIALQQDPRNATLLCDLGYCYFLQGQLSKAEAALMKATALEPSNQRHWNNLGLVVGHMGRHEEALAHFRKAGSEADAQYNMAFIYASQERVAEAKECFEAALAADPAHRRAREALASFEAYERLPEHLRDLDALADSGVRYVPYIEGNEAGAQQAFAQERVATGMNASRASRALLLESQDMRRNMASQRADEAAGP